MEVGRPVGCVYLPTIVGVVGLGVVMAGASLNWRLATVGWLLGGLVVGLAAAVAVAISRRDAA